MFAAPIVEVAGTPYEIGHAHGTHCKKQVLASLNYYTKMFANKKIDWEKGKRLAKTYEEAVKAFDPDLIEEMKGIADGAGLTYEDILAINCRSEVTMMDVSGKLADLDEPEDGCTAFAVMPSMTRDGKTLHAQTWDFGTMQREAIIVLKIRQQNGKPDILMITEGGLVGGKGMNSAGVSLTLNALRTSGDPTGVPLHVLMRGMLNSPTITKAYQKAANFQSGCSAGLILGCKDGCALSVEVVPGDLDVFYPVDGYVVHTNHVLSARFPNIRDNGKRASASSYLRYGRCCALLKGRHDITVEQVKEILSDHVGYPNGICVHADPNLPIEKQSSSNYGVIFNLTDGVTHLCVGNPCESEYVTLTL